MTNSTRLIPIVKVPDPILRKVAEPVTEITDGIRQILDEMAATMYDAPGIGLDGPQVKVSKRLVVIDCSKDETHDLYKMINPKIIRSSNKRSVLEEGCLSIPDHTAEVERPAEVEIQYLDETGCSKKILADGLFAACVQHEIDHLNGKLFIDHISRLKKDMIMRKMIKNYRQAEKQG